ncbi:uncharacterized protein LOC135196971 [Macrobrachium nipponense]|uniref:uncharacterized protein LOC135196971 n=1 Tax=Macrobrachium nipponense TaxID=159736 RepID=UPI0030C86290
MTPITECVVLSLPNGVIPVTECVVLYLPNGMIPVTECVVLYLPNGMIPFNECVVLSLPNGMIPVTECVVLYLPNGMIPVNECVVLYLPSGMIPVTECVVLSLPNGMIPVTECVVLSLPNGIIPVTECVVLSLPNGMTPITECVVLSLLNGMTPVTECFVLYYLFPMAERSEKNVPLTYILYFQIRYLKQMRKPVQSSLQKGRIHAVQAQQGRKRYAQITIKGDNEFCLHHLRDEAPSYEFHTVDYDELMEEINTAAGLTFLELGIGQDCLGRLLIRLSLPSTNKAHHFYLLCTGEKGPSYANTNCLKVWNKGDDKTEFAVFGDYEENDGSGGKAIIPGVDWEEENQKDEHMMPWVEGLVGGKSTEATAAMFGIFLRDNPGSELPGCFGKVEKGLEVLTDALDKNPDVGKCRIVDCGVVFSM